MPRFKPIEKGDKNEPSPVSYNYDEAIAKSKWTKTLYTVGKDKTSRDFFGSNAKRQNYKPAPNKHSIEQCFNHLSKSPRLKAKRH